MYHLNELREFVQLTLEEGPIKKSLASLAVAGSMLSPSQLDDKVPEKKPEPTFSSVDVVSSGEHSKFDEFPDKQLRLSFAEVRPLIQKASKRYGVSPSLIDAIIKTESNYRPYVGSRVGAQGMMQLMPKTAAWLGVDNVYDPEQNIMGGTKYIKMLLKKFEGDIELATAAYNAGPLNVIKHNGVPPFKETQAYVKRIKERMATSRFR